MKRKKDKSILIALLLVLFFLAFLTAFFFFFKGTKIYQETLLVKTENQNCIERTEERTVRGTSLSGLIEAGSTVKILFGYYSCNEVKRGDIVAYNYAGDANPIIKIVKGIPGDKFHLQEANGVWNILINGDILKNSQNQPYLLGERGHRMLALYERDYKSIIPADTYLILGNLASGSLDSTRFGLIGKQDILGRVEF